MRPPFTVTGKLMLYPGHGRWHFVPLSKGASARIAKIKTPRRAAWGYIKVRANIGGTTWHTTLWPKQAEGVYLIVVSAPVRKKEGIYEGDAVRITIEIL